MQIQYSSALGYIQPVHMYTGDTTFLTTSSEAILIFEILMREPKKNGLHAMWLNPYAVNLNNGGEQRECLFQSSQSDWSNCLKTTSYFTPRFNTSLLNRWLLFAHNDVIKWKHFPRYWPFARGIHRSPMNSPHKGQWRGTLMFSLICAWINR